MSTKRHRKQKKRKNKTKHISVPKRSERVENPPFFWDIKLLILFVISKVITVSAVLFFFYYFDTSHTINLWNRWYSGKSILDAIYIPFSNWDGQHYLLLADKGYGFWQHSQAFFPLFPLLIRLFNFFINNFYLSSFIVNLLFSYLFVLFYYNYALKYSTKRDALHSAIFVMAFPSAFYLTVFYSEAIFLCLLFGFLYFYSRKSYWSTVFVLFIPLARGQSLFILFALIIILLWRLIKKIDIDHKYELSNILSCMIGFFLYFLFMDLTTGSAFSGLDAQKGFVFNNSLNNIINPLNFISYIFSNTTGTFSYNNSLIDKIFIIGLIVSIPIVVKSKDVVVIFLFITLVYFPASMGNGGSYLRHSLVAIPFLSMVIFSVFQPRNLVMYPILAVFLSLQVYLVYRFSLNMWVA